MARDERLADDLLWGIKEISRYVGRTPRQVGYMIDKGVLPAKRLGPRTLVARKSEVDDAMLVFRAALSRCCIAARGG
jgi:hypothetical protein